MAHDQAPEFKPVTYKRRVKPSGQTKPSGQPRGLDDNTTTFKTAKTSTSYRKALKEARMSKKWKQKDLAQRVNATQSDVQKWESGKSVPPPNVRNKLNRVLGTKLPKIKKVKNRGDQ